MNPLAQRIERLRQEYNRQLLRALTRESVVVVAATSLLGWVVAHRWGHVPWVLAGIAGTLLVLGWGFRRRLHRQWVSARAAIQTIEDKLQLKERLLTAREWFEAKGERPRFFDALVSDLNA